MVMTRWVGTPWGDVVRCFSFLHRTNEYALFGDQAGDTCFPDHFAVFSDASSDSIPVQKAELKAVEPLIEGACHDWFIMSRGTNSLC